MGEQNIRVFIADDHVFVVDVLRSQFSRGQDFEFSGRASNLDELFSRLSARTNVLLLDKMAESPEMLAAISKVQAQFPPVKVVLFTGQEDLAFAKQALETGARGYLSKSLSMEEICQDLKKIHTGGVVIDLGKASPPAEDDCMEAKKLITPTEKQVIALLCKGFRTREIAEMLTRINNRNMEPATVEVHKRRIREKLKDYGVANDASLGYWACQCQLLDGNELSSHPEE
ncbi:MAG: response regulator transcription factor [Phaeodactylibacter sp.]|nr:response regulator transcription factor [Phaeodactylibacter sp.]MCB9295491.1 response regulator transcription factor [Lewinellaceae bacterium]